MTTINFRDFNLPQLREKIEDGAVVVAAFALVPTSIYASARLLESIIGQRDFTTGIFLKAAARFAALPSLSTQDHMTAAGSYLRAADTMPTTNPEKLKLLQKAMAEADEARKIGFDRTRGWAEKTVDLALLKINIQRQIDVFTKAWSLNQGRSLSLLDAEAIFYESTFDLARTTEYHADEAFVAMQETRMAFAKAYADSASKDFASGEFAMAVEKYDSAANLYIEIASNYESHDHLQAGGVARLEAANCYERASEVVENSNHPSRKTQRTLLVKARRLYESAVLTLERNLLQREKDPNPAKAVDGRRLKAEACLDSASLERKLLQQDIGATIKLSQPDLLNRLGRFKDVTHRAALAYALVNTHKSADLYSEVARLEKEMAIVKALDSQGFEWYSKISPVEQVGFIRDTITDWATEGRHTYADLPTKTFVAERLAALSRPSSATTPMAADKARADGREEGFNRPDRPAEIEGKPGFLH